MDVMVPAIGFSLILTYIQDRLFVYMRQEKVSALRTREYFAARARRADPAKIARILKRVGKGNPPVEGDELPPEFAAKKKSR
jgi:hypothetical protein